MRFKACGCLALALTVAVAAAPSRAGTAELNDGSYDRWRDHLLPKKEELGWLSIPWRPNFWEGVAEANRADKPILMWTMNGHPMACT